MKADVLKFLSSVCLLAFMAVVLPGCTRNNGDIGNWFGTWQMTEVAADGEPQHSYERNIFWKFQNDIIVLVKVQTSEGEHSRDDRWGTWEETGDRLLLDFTYSDDEYSEEDGGKGYGRYAPFPELHIPYGEVSTLIIESRSGNRMKLRYVASDNVEYTYTLKKQ